MMNFYKKKNQTAAEALEAAYIELGKLVAYHPDLVQNAWDNHDGCQYDDGIDGKVDSIADVIEYCHNYLNNH